MLLHRFLPVSVCLQNTMVRSCIHPPPWGYSTFFSTHDLAQVLHWRHCIIDTDLWRCSSYTVHGSFSITSSIAIYLHLTRTYIICSLYLLPSKPVDRVALESLIRQLQFPYLILGDLNVGHPMWDDNITNPQGNMLASLIEDFDLGHISTGAVTHYHTETDTASMLDLSLCFSDAYLAF